MRLDMFYKSELLEVPKKFETRTLFLKNRTRTGLPSSSSNNPVTNRKDLEIDEEKVCRKKAKLLFALFFSSFALSSNFSKWFLTVLFSIFVTVLILLFIITPNRLPYQPHLFFSASNSFSSFSPLFLSTVLSL